MSIRTEQTRSWNHLGLFVTCAILGLTIAVRLPFLFPLVINWDESTQILMGQNLLDGQLPYVQLWDNKPPLSFLAYALFLGLLGKSIVAVRIGGLLFVAATALVTYLIGSATWRPRAGLISALFCVVFVSTSAFGQATMTEIIALLPLMGALAVLVTKEFGAGALFAAGVLLGVASLVRLNLGYVALLVGLFLVLQLSYSFGWRSNWRLLGYAAGGLLPVLITAAPYLATGQGGLWLASVFLAPLHYSAAQHSYLQAFGTQLRHGFRLRNGLLWTTFLIGAAWIVGTWTRQTSRQKHGCLLIGVFLLGTVWSIVASGAALPHYLLQIVPLLSLIAGAFVDRLLSTRWRLVVATIVALGLIVAVKPIASQYLVMGKRVFNGQPAVHGAALQIAAFLEKENPTGDPVYLMTDHIVYWLTDSHPLTKATTHPSNIAKEYMLEAIAGPGASTLRELQKVLEQRPEFIVKNDREFYLVTKPATRKFLNIELAEHYILVAEIEGRLIYKRRTTVTSGRTESTAKTASKTR